MIVNTKESESKK